MIRMYVVFSVLGQVYGVAGPIDRSAWSCSYVLTKAKQYAAMYLEANPAEFRGRRVTMNQVTTKCVMARQMPEAPYRFSVPQQ